MAAVTTSVSVPKTLSSPSRPNARLLYRGALSLPDSNMLLDGLTFTIDLPHSDAPAALTLLETPLPLALESLRGRSTIRFIDIVDLNDVICDFTEKVHLHIHPRCILTKQLFENSICALPLSQATGLSIRGIRISLQDDNRPGSNDILVFGRPHPSSSKMQLCVARILPKAKAGLSTQNSANTIASRPPRPDDPTPRKPPATFGMARIGAGMKRTMSLKATAPSDECVFGGAKKRKDEAEENDVAVADDKDNSQLSQRTSSFKVPAAPSTKALVSEGKDVTKNNKSSPMDVDNKAFIKKAAMRLMNAAGVTKSNASFKDFFNAVYHGTMFALRSKIGTVNIENDAQLKDLVDRIAQAHVTLYLGGSGVGVLLLQQQ